MEQRVFSVTQVNNYIKGVMDSDPLLGGLLVRGELSNYKIYPSGHHYFTLKDAEGSLRCVMYQGKARSLRFRPADGMQVIASGNITVFPRDGTYKLYCDSLSVSGVGDLHMAYEQLKEKLYREGLFDQAHKKPLPRYPQRIAVITDSGTDTPAAFAAEHDVRVIPLRINYSDGSTYENGVDITAEEVVERFAEEIPSTSLPSPMKIRDTLEQARRDGYTGAVVVTISSGLSATFETIGMVARQMEDFPVVMVDTKSIGIAAGFVVMEAARQIEAGMPLDRLGSVLAAVSERVRVFFSVQKLDFLRKGGRISEAVYRVGSVLNIKPVLTCSPEGKYVIEKKARGWQRALDTQIALVAEQAARWQQVRLAVCTYDPALREELVPRLRERIGNAVEILQTGLSADLLVHTGPTLVGMGVMGL